MKSKDISNLLVGQERKSRNPGNGSAPSGEPVKKPASLLDDTLSDSRKKTNWKTPIWIAGLVIIASLLTVFFVGADGSANGPLDQAPGASRNPELLEKLVSEAKVSGEEGEPGESEAAEAPAQAAGTPASSNSADPEPSGNSTQQLAENRPPEPAPRPSPPPAREPASGSVSQSGAAASTPADESSGEAAQQTSERPEGMPDLIRDMPREEPTEESATPEENDSTGFDRQQEAFDYLENNAPVAGKLIRGGFSNLNYSGWKVIRETNQEIWIDVEATWDSGGPAIHHIWSVDLENNSVKALSQAARNLEALQN